MDRDWVLRVLREACSHAGVASSPEFIQGVIDGLGVGERRYGEFAYVGRDNSREGRFEARDAAAYALMEMADNQTAFECGEITEHARSQAQGYLLQVLVLAAHVDQSFKAARDSRYA